MKGQLVTLTLDNVLTLSIFRSFFIHSPLPPNSPHAPLAQIVFQKPVIIPCYMIFSMMAFLSFPLM